MPDASHFNKLLNREFTDIVQSPAVDVPYPSMSQAAETAARGGDDANVKLNLKAFWDEVFNEPGATAMKQSATPPVVTAPAAIAQRQEAKVQVIDQSNPYTQPFKAAVEGAAPRDKTADKAADLDR